MYQVKRGGTYCEPTKVWIKTNGSYCEAQLVWVKRNGSYCQSWTSVPQTSTVAITSTAGAWPDGHPTSFGSYKTSNHITYIGSDVQFRGTATLGGDAAAAAGGRVQLQWRLVGEPDSRWTDFASATVKADGSWDVDYRTPVAMVGDIEIQAVFHPTIGPDADTGAQHLGVFTPHAPGTPSLKNSHWNYVDVSWGAASFHGVVGAEQYGLFTSSTSSTFYGHSTTSRSLRYNGTGKHTFYVRAWREDRNGTRYYGPASSGRAWTPPAKPPPPVPAHVSLSYRSHVVHSPQGYHHTRDDAQGRQYAYYGYYSGTWGSMWSEIPLNGSPTYTRVTGGHITIRSAHAYLNSGADVRIEFGYGQSIVVHSPKSGTISFNISKAQAQALARSKKLTIRPLSNSRNHYGYFDPHVSVTLNQH